MKLKNLSTENYFSIKINGILYQLEPEEEITLPDGVNEDAIRARIKDNPNIILREADLMYVRELDMDGNNKFSAADVPYDNSISGLSAETTQAAIDEIFGGAGNIKNLKYKGNWNASINDPALSDDGGGGVQNEFYIVNVAGTTTIDGINDWEVNDWIINTGTFWTKIDGSNLVVSVNSKVGAVELNAEDIPYDNSDSGLAATEVKSAIDEVQSNIILSGSRTYEEQVLHDISVLNEATPDVILTGTAAGDLQTALDALTEGQILQIDTNAVYSPILLPTTNGIKVKVGNGFMPSLTGSKCMKIPDGASNQIYSGLLFENCTTTDSNAYGAAIGLEHQAKFDNLIFWNITIRKVTVGSGVMISYHQSIGGDNYATASTLAEMSTKLAFVDCLLHMAVNEKIEGASLALRGINRPFIYNVKVDSQNQGRGISLQNSINCMVADNKVINCQDGNGGEGIKIDALGTPVGYTNTGVFKNNVVAHCIEGIDIDDIVDCLVMNNTAWDCSNEGISFDNNSTGVCLGNVTYNNVDGIEVETGAVIALKKNISFNNSGLNYNLPVGYVLDDSNSTSMLDTFIGSNSLPFVANVPANWAVAPPVNSLDAMNRIANALATLAGAPIA